MNIVEYFGLAEVTKKVRDVRALFRVSTCCASVDSAFTIGPPYT